MKKLLTGFMLLVSVAVCFAQQANTPGTGTYANKSELSSLPASCDSYASCIELGNKEKALNGGSVLLHYSLGQKDIRYNLFEDISVKLSSNSCPPNIVVFKVTNNINFILDVFQSKRKGQCSTYYANITGDGKKRDSVIGQLEIKFCSDDELHENCDNSVLYSKINYFEEKKDKQSRNMTQENYPSGNGVGNPNPGMFNGDNILNNGKY